MQEFNSLKDLALNSRYITYATVNEDGSPHNSPMFYIPSIKLDKIYIGTHPDSLHAQNIYRTGKAFGVLVGRTPDGGRGLYIKVENFHEATSKELHEALAAHNEARDRINKKPLTVDYYQSPKPQRMYLGDIVELSTNDVIRDQQGHIEKDTRCVIKAEELM